MSNLSTLQTNVAAELGLVNTSAGDQPQITAALNKAVVDMLRRTHCYIVSATSTLTAGVYEYDLDSSILAIDEIWVSASGVGGHELERVDSRTVKRNVAYSQTVQGTPYMYALLGANRLVVFPVPNAADTMTQWYVPRPTAMSAGANDPSTATYGGIPAEFHDGLELYAEWRLGSLADDASSGQGARYKQDYLEFIRDMKADLFRKGGKRLPRLLPPAQRRQMILRPGQTLV